MLTVREKRRPSIRSGRPSRRDRRRRPALLHVDLIQVAVVGRPEDDDVLAAPSPVGGKTASLSGHGERPGPREGNDR